MGSKSQVKGRRAELELARILQSYGYPVEAGRALSYGEVSDLSGLPGVHIECKRCEQLRLPEWMAQAKRDAQRFGDGAPTIFHRRNRQGWLVTMRLEDWLAFYKRAKTDDCGKGVLNDTQQRKGACGPPDPCHKEGSSGGGGD